MLWFHKVAFPFLAIVKMSQSGKNKQKRSQRNLSAEEKLSPLYKVARHFREIKTRVYGKRQTSDSRLRFLKINNGYTKMVQNNSHVYG